MRRWQRLAKTPSRAWPFRRLGGPLEGMWLRGGGAAESQHLFWGRPEGLHGSVSRLGTYLARYGPLARTIRSRRPGDEPAGARQVDVPGRANRQMRPPIRTGRGGPEEACPTPDRNPVKIMPLLSDAKTPVLP